MSTPSTQQAPPRICLTDPQTVAAWCTELKCTETQLRSAVYSVGSQPYWIRKYFRPFTNSGAA
jgi:hypothetical protein